MKFISAISLFVTATQAVRLEQHVSNTELLQAQQTIAAYEQTQELAKLQERVDAMDKEMWNLWGAASNWVKHNVP